MQGLVLPPRVAPTQVVVIPIPATSLTDEQRQELKAKTQEIVAGLKAQGLRVHIDDRDNYRPGWKYNHWELKVSNLMHPIVRPDPSNTSSLAVYRHSKYAHLEVHVLRCLLRPAVCCI